MQPRVYLSAPRIHLRTLQYRIIPKPIKCTNYANGTMTFSNKKVPAARADTTRLVEIDSLRGLAAIAVVLFHYTSHFLVLYAPTLSPLVSVKYGYFGVNLFFIISGFVIFMTLERTSRSMDFVVSRFSRLFPAYWVAVAITYCVTHYLGLPGKLVDLDSALKNMAMLHGLLFHVPHVDGVYWTLEVELLFYFGMWLLYRLNMLSKIHIVLAGLMVVRLTYFGFATAYGIDLPWMVSRILILQYIPWFALGICIYLLSKTKSPAIRLRSQLMIAFAVATLLVVESSPWGGLLALCLAWLVWIAATRPVALLRRWPLVWLGTISYPLYLLHENIGWSIQLRLLELGAGIDTTIVAALCLGLALATAMTYSVEQPSMRLIRNWYRNQAASRANK